MFPQLFFFYNFEQCQKPVNLVSRGSGAPFAFSQDFFLTLLVFRNKNLNPSEKLVPGFLFALAI